LIRHGKEDKESSHRFDEHLSKNVVSFTQKFGEKLSEKFGKPDIVYTSPYQRTAETAKNITSHLDVENYFLPLLARFYPSNQPVDISEATREKKVPIHESKSKFNKRIMKLIKFLRKESKKYKLIWCVTHTSVIKKLAKILGLALDSWIDFNQYLIVKRKTLKLVKESEFKEHQENHQEASCPYCKFKKNA
jgi:broad specificity phosphatase PhoE